MTGSEACESLANVVTALGFPFAIFVFWAERRKAREYEAQQTWALLTDNYIRFMELVLVPQGAPKAKATRARRGPG
jgi:hypothetical protein